jgi:hypothetical protein
MWKKYITIFQNSPSDVKDYFEYIQIHFKDLLSSISKATLLEEINKPNDDLFYHRKNMDKFFYEQHICEVVACFRYYFEIDWEFLSFQATPIILTLNESYKKEFYFLQKSNLANHISLDLERVLYVNTHKAQFIFLFLFFMPCISKKELLFHSRKNRPLISCNGISIENFYMLQELMKLYEKETYELFCKDYNFNHQLIEDYMESSQKLAGYQNNIKWEEELPLEKMNNLLDEGCSFTDFEFFRNNKNRAIYPNLHSILMKLQSSLVLDRLGEKLSVKLIDDKKLVKL